MIQLPGGDRPAGPRRGGARRVAKLGQSDRTRRSDHRILAAMSLFAGGGAAIGQDGSARNHAAYRTF
eukprot:150125-Hanusia_phi.AAC.1